MEIFLVRVRVALFLLVLLFAFGCGRFDQLVAGMDGSLQNDGGGNSDVPGTGKPQGNSNFPSSCSNSLGKFVKSVPIEISQISLSNTQGSSDFVINENITMEGLEMAKALDKALNVFGPIAVAKYSYIVLKVKGASLILKDKWGGDVLEVNPASGELKLKLTPEYVVSADGKRGRILFDLCKNLVLQGPGKGNGDENNGPYDDNDKPKGCTLTPEVKGKVVYP